MRMRRMCLTLMAISIAATLFFRPGRALGTAPEQYKTSLIAVGRFRTMDISSFFPDSPTAKQKEELWSSLRDERDSDVYVQNNLWAPGGSSGWHSHPGPSLIIVIVGTVTEYEGHDPACKGHVYQAGMGFVDPGGDHIHILRNEGSVEARTVAVQIIPASANQRIEVADPGNCHF